MRLLARGGLKTQPPKIHFFSPERIKEAFETAHPKDETGAIFVALTLRAQNRHGYTIYLVGIRDRSRLDFRPITIKG